MKYSTSAASTIGWLRIAWIPLGLLPAQVASGSVRLFATEGFGDRTTLAEIDWTTGMEIDTVSHQSDVGIEGLAYDPSADRLFGYAPFQGLYSINYSTGLFTQIAPAASNIYSLAIHPTTFELYGMSLSGTLYTLNKTTGAATAIGSDPDFSTVHGLAFDARGTLYACDTAGMGTSQLFVVDPTNGSAVHAATINYNYVVSIDFHPDGTLYGSENGFPRLLTIDIETGFATVVGPYGSFATHGGIAFVPCPPIGVLFILGAAISRRRRN
jgi:WD40 repeat protein